MAKVARLLSDRDKNHRPNNKPLSGIILTEAALWRRTQKQVVKIWGDRAAPAAYGEQTLQPYCVIL